MASSCALLQLDIVQLVSEHLSTQDILRLTAICHELGCCQLPITLSRSCSLALATQLVAAFKKRCQVVNIRLSFDGNESNQTLGTLMGMSEISSLHTLKRSDCVKVCDVSGHSTVGGSGVGAAVLHGPHAGM